MTELSERPWRGDDLSPEALHRRVLAEIGDAHDPVTAGRRSIVERHWPMSPVGWWVACHGPHGSEGDEYEWPCDDYLDAAGPALPQ